MESSQCPTRSRCLISGRPPPLAYAPPPPAEPHPLAAEKACSSCRSRPDKHSHIVYLNERIRNRKCTRTPSTSCSRKVVWPQSRSSRKRPCFDSVLNGRKCTASWLHRLRRTGGDIVLCSRCPPHSLFFSRSCDLQKADEAQSDRQKPGSLNHVTVPNTWHTQTSGMKQTAQASSPSINNQELPALTGLLP